MNSSTNKFIQSWLFPKIFVQNPECLLSITLQLPSNCFLQNLSASTRISTMHKSSWDSESTIQGAEHIVEGKIITRDFLSLTLLTWNTTPWTYPDCQGLTSSQSCPREDWANTVPNSLSNRKLAIWWEILKSCSFTLELNRAIQDQSKLSTSLRWEGEGSSVPGSYFMCLCVCMLHWIIIIFEDTFSHLILAFRVISRDPKWFVTILYFLYFITR